eukprot:11221874-Prorocentrum_lima.AAC.1
MASLAQLEKDVKQLGTLDDRLLVLEQARLHDHDVDLRTKIDVLEKSLASWEGGAACTQTPGAPGPGPAPSTSTSAATDAFQDKVVDCHGMEDRL